MGPFYGTTYIGGKSLYMYLGFCNFSACYLKSCGKEDVLKKFSLFKSNLLLIYLKTSIISPPLLYFSSGKFKAFSLFSSDLLVSEGTNLVARL